MHSSRMRTVRSSGRRGGGVSAARVSAQGLYVCIRACIWEDTAPCEQND